MLKVLLVVAAIAVIVWVLVKLMLRRLDGGGGSDGGSRPRILGPDDDPDFLRGLDRKPKPAPKPDDD